VRVQSRSNMEPSCIRRAIPRSVTEERLRLAIMQFARLGGLRLQIDLLQGQVGDSVHPFLRVGCDQIKSSSSTTSAMPSRCEAMTTPGLLFLEMNSVK
jgi:hypothetical protein